MKVSYGPPGIGGVKTLQYVSGTDGLGDTTGDLLAKVARPVGLVATGVWAYAKWGTKDRKLTKQASGVALGALLIEILGRVS